MQGFTTGTGRNSTETIYRLALHAKYRGEDFFGLYNGATFERGCLEPVDFKALADAMTIAKIQAINVAAEEEYSGKCAIAIDKFTMENGTTHILPMAYIHIDGDGLNPYVEEIS